MEESHGKQDSCQEGQDHLGHLLEREDPNIASHSGGGRDKDKPFSPQVLSVSPCTAAPPQRDTHLVPAQPGALHQGCKGAKQQRLPCATTAPVPPGDQHSSHSSWPQLLWNKSSQKGVLSCPAAQKGKSYVRSVQCQGTGTQPLRLQRLVGFFKKTALNPPQSQQG